MRGIKKIEHITTCRTFYADTELNETYIITYAEGQFVITHNFTELPEKAKKFFSRKYNYPHLFNQDFRFTFKHIVKTDTYTFKDPI